MDTTYDIFREFPDGGPIWVEAVQGLDNARARLIRLLEAHAGDYFVYDSFAAKIVATTVDLLQTPASATASAGVGQRLQLPLQSAH